MDETRRLNAERFEALSYTDQVNIHPLGLAILGVTLCCLLVLKRQHILVPVLLMLCFVAPAQRILFAGIDLSFLRIAAIVLVLVSLARGWIGTVRWNWLDAAVVAFALLTVPAALLRGSSGALGGVLGKAGDLAASYVAARAIIRDRATWVVLIRTLFLISIPVSIFFVVEKTTGRNMFSIFGGVPEVTAIRDGKLRAQGAFAHPILAGSWWAICVPLFLSARYFDPSPIFRRAIPILGTSCAVLLLVMTASSTPLGALLVGGMAWFAYAYRRTVWDMRWGILAVAFVLHMLAESGLHGLFLARLSFVSGSTGYHRYLLIDAAINRVPEWFLFGVNSTWHWGIGLDDVCCQYVAACVSGGITVFILLMIIVVNSITIPWRYAMQASDEVSRRLAWGVMAAMATNAAAFIAVTYFGQIVFLLALLTAVSLNMREIMGDPVMARVSKPRTQVGIGEGRLGAGGRSIAAGLQRGQSS